MTPTEPAVEFVDRLPETTRKSTGRSRWEDRTAEQLRAQPGEWAVVRRGPAYNKVSPYVTFLRRVGCEAHSRRVSDTEVVVYARWPG